MLKNNIEVEAKILTDPVVVDNKTQFNVSILSNKEKLDNGKVKNRFTNIKVICCEPKEKFEKQDLIYISGKLDSEIYFTKNNKSVFNKVIYAKELKLVRKL